VGHGDRSHGDRPHGDSSKKYDKFGRLINE